MKKAKVAFNSILFAVAHQSTSVLKVASFENKLRKYFSLAGLKFDVTIDYKPFIFLGQEASVSPFETTKSKSIFSKKKLDKRFAIDLDY